MFSNQIYELDTDQFWNARPFPHVIIDNFLDPEFALLVANEFPTMNTLSYVDIIIFWSIKSF